MNCMRKYQMQTENKPNCTPTSQTIVTLVGERWMKRRLEWHHSESITVLVVGEGHGCGAKRTWTLVLGERGQHLGMIRKLQSCSKWGQLCPHKIECVNSVEICLTDVELTDKRQKSEAGGSRKQLSTHIFLDLSPNSYATLIVNHNY